MITSTKNYTKKPTKNKKRTDRTLGQMVKGKLYRQKHTKKHTHTHPQKEKKEKNICLLGSLRSSASIQLVFCRSCSTCRCISDVFVGRKLISTSYSSATLKVSHFWV